MSPDVPAPFEAPLQRVLPEWIDGNGHMNVAFYLRAFDLASDAAFDAFGLGWNYTVQGQGSTFTLETHLRYLQEVKADDPLRMTLQLLDCDPKRVHYFMTMSHAETGYLAATMETLTIHVSLVTRCTAPFPAPQHATLLRVLQAHRQLPRPEGAGRSIGIGRL